jgi:hypothetical protein
MKLRLVVTAGFLVAPIPTWRVTPNDAECAVCGQATMPPGPLAPRPPGPPQILRAGPTSRGAQVLKPGECPLIRAHLRRIASLRSRRCRSPWWRDASAHRSNSACPDLVRRVPVTCKKSLFTEPRAACYAVLGRRAIGARRSRCESGSHRTAELCAEPSPTRSMMAAVQDALDVPSPARSSARAGSLRSRRRRRPRSPVAGDRGARLRGRG